MTSKSINIRYAGGALDGFAQLHRKVFLDSFKEFFVKWWCGPNDVAKDMVREVGYAVGVMKSSKFYRDSGLLTWALNTVPWREFRNLNLFISTAFYIDIGDVEQAESKALYDRLFYDFDSKENPKLAIEKAIEFSKSLKSRFGCDAVIAFSGLHGAHVTVPLKKPITWSVYSKLWDILIAPYSFGNLVDRKVKEPRRLYRVPYTYNVKEDGVGFSYIMDLEGKKVRMEDFDWDSYEPLDPQRVDVVEFEAVDLPKLKIVTVSRKPRTVDSEPKARLPEDPAELDKCDAVPSCIRNIVQALKTAGDPDHFQRLALVWYLKWVGYSVEDVVEMFKRFAKDFNEKVTRYQVEFAYGLRGSKKDYLPPSCEWMKQHNICLNCGWSEKHKNIVTYTYAKAYVPEEVRKNSIIY
jgi:Eukaryotic-type DNA primase, large subunit